MKLQRLYKKNQHGKISFKDLYTRKVRGEDQYLKLVRTGTLDKEGKAKISSKLVKVGKNIGRSNETTVKQQAEKEHISEWKSQFGKGYKTDLAYIKNYTYNTFEDESQMPMLLNKFKPSKFKAGYGQRKYDGVRCIAEVHNGALRLKSREGHIYNIPHISNDVKELMKYQLDQSFDGELYCHGMLLQDIGSLAKSGDVDKKLKLVIYDIPIKNLEFSQRRNLMLALDVSELDYLQVDAGIPINTVEEFEKYYEECLGLKYEGGIYCDPSAMYQFGFRTSGKQKMKPRETDEFICVDQYMNKGKYSKQSTLICLTKDGKKFHVKLQGTNAQREEWASNFDKKVKNKKITVAYRMLSKDGKPLEATGVAIRDYE
tara:strand:- start:1014 stop:2129 length:1116 start_codon:yes stop_codon:yes gene_type:complete